MEEITLACTWYMVCRALKTQGLKPIKSLETRGQWFYRSAATRAKMPYISYANLVNLSLEKMAFMPLFTKCLHPPHPSPKPCQDQCIYGGMTQKKKVK